MASTNMSGASDTDLTNNLTQPNAGALPPDATTGDLGEPVDVVEVVEIDSYEPTPAGYGANMGDATGLANRPGFQWWMVPAVAVPVAAGATATVLLLRRRQKPAPVAAYNKLAKQSRDWMDAVRGSQATKSASKALSQGVESVRGAAKNLPDAASGWRDSAGDLLGTVATSASAKQASEGVKGLLDSVTGFWNTNAPRAKQAVREQGRNTSAKAAVARTGVLDLFSGGKAQDTASSVRARVSKVTSKAADRADKLTSAAKPVAAAAAMKAAKAATQTNRATKRAGKRATNAAKRTRAFTFGMLVAATVTYWRAWQQRLQEKETRETAGGRMVKA